MIIIFSDCGFIIVAIIFFLCGSYKVGEVIADFIVDNCYIILVVLLIATFLISLYSVRDNYSKSVQITATIGFTILDFAKMLILYLLIVTWAIDCNGVQREHNKKLNNGLPILHKVPPKRDYGRYFCIMAEKGGTSHGGLTEKLSLFFHAKKQEVNAYGR